MGLRKLWVLNLSWAWATISIHLACTSTTIGASIKLLKKCIIIQVCRYLGTIVPAIMIGQAKSEASNIRLSTLFFLTVGSCHLLFTLSPSPSHSEQRQRSLSRLI